ncbi:VanZ family protein [Streptomyces sp. TRM 70361]|uniref:VanZ family protein n=1 Tax=Streptomyces sp. TRM 70361 TaxID=3116553 RepID=UPI002E7B2BBA|nr:VanZ family protein [Streptomyces sp. TRM 70361]MEE1940163.1 VanZ family protein [Streptomyces sp. TRM 70361]
MGFSPLSRGKDRAPADGRHGDGDTSATAPSPTGPPPVVRALVMLVALAATVLFAVVLARLTLTPSYASQPLTHSNLQPGDSIRDYLSQPAFRDTLKQLGGNIALGVPFGLLLPVAWPRAGGLLRIGALTVLVMTMVELVQGAVVTGRAFDIDDVILNTTGALLGYLLLGRRLGRAVHPPRRRWWHRFGGRERSGAARAGEG